MASGATSVAIVCETADGKMIFAETSAKLLIMAAEATRGAMERFGDKEGTAEAPH